MANKASFFTQCFIEIGGQAVSRDFMSNLAEVVVDSSLHMPDMFTIMLYDAALKWVDDGLLDVGKEVRISVQTGQEQGGHEGTLIKGEITALEPHFCTQGKTTFLLRGYDKSHRLHRGRKTRTFVKQSDDQIVQKIAGEAGLALQIDRVNITHDYVLQNNQTNMEFLLSRAERIGYQVYVVEDELYFKKGDAVQRGGPTLAFAEDLLGFQPCLTAANQADTVVVRGWDAKAKQVITAQSAPGSNLNQGGLGQTGGDTARGAFGAAEAVTVNQPLCTVDEAQALAIGLSNDIGREFVQAEGVCYGNPGVKAGWQVTITGVGQRFSGDYFVTRAVHVYNKQGYETTFSISGRQPNTLRRLLDAGNGHSDQARGLLRGVVTGLVTNLNDPDKLGRVKVKYDWLGNIESDWVRLAAPMAGAERGFYYLPEVNDEVLLAFEHGDAQRPYVLGALWNSRDRPPKPNDQVVANGKVNERILMSRSGHVIIFDDTQGQEKIIIRDMTETNEIVIDSQAGNLTITIGNDIVVGNQGNVTLESQGDLTLSAAGKLNIKGNDITIDGGPTTTVKGGTIKLN